MNTPWGKADNTFTLCEGIIDVSTPSHGGIRVDKTMQNQFSDYTQKAALREYGALWYEEDCDWALVIQELSKICPEAVARFQEKCNCQDILKIVETTLRHWHPGYFNHQEEK